MFSRVKALVLTGVCALALAGCNADSGVSGRAFRSIPSDTVAKMEQLGTTKSAPVLIRAYKKEAELEIWKMKADGRYVLLKTFPMCRWSGQLGPKTREGDRQVPEGFYTITPGQMNPNSNYYLSFNVGYPNAFDKAHGRGGGLIMVHGACSSAGCFSMTDDQIAEIYAIAREAFSGGQRGIQMQSMPFRMNAENLAKHRFDPNIGFWKDLKEGVDQFDVTKQEPQVGVCGRRYVFNARAANGGRLDPTGACPPMVEDQEVKSAVLAKQQKDDQAVAELVAKGVKAVRVQYADGGQHPSFAYVSNVSRPDAVAQGPIEIAMEEKAPKGQKPALVQVAAAKALTPVVAVASIPAKVVETAAAPIASGVSTLAKSNAANAKANAQANAAAAAAAAAPAPAPAPDVAAEAEPPPSSPFYKRWLGLAPKQEPKPVETAEPDAPQPANVPLPPRRASAAQPKPHAALSNGMSFAAMTGLRKAVKVDVAARKTLPDNVRAYAE